MKAALRVAIVFLLLGPALDGAVRGDDTKIPELQPGDRGLARTVIQGAEIQEIPVKFLGTLRNATGPGYDLHLVQLEGPIAEKIGVAAGMSGSPVYFAGQLIGALSYRLGTIPKDAIAGVTPIRDMIAAERAVGYRPPADSQATPIVTPISAGGMVAPVREWLEPVLQEMGFVLVVGDAGVEDDEFPGKLEPGSPVGVALVRGDLSMAATGTVTHVDGDRILAFGHPFFGSGRVEMPMHTATVIHTLADSVGSSKLSRIGREVGAIVDDRLPAIVGRTDLRARMIPVEVRLKGGDYGEQRFNFDVVKNSNLAPILTSAVLANTLVSNSGFDGENTMVARGRIHLNRLPDLPFEMSFAGGGGANPGVAIAGRVYQMLSTLWTNGYEEVDVEHIEVDVDVLSEVRRYHVDALIRDRETVRSGETISIRCVLRRFEAENVSHEIELVVPEGIVGDRSLTLAVGPPTYIERVLGSPITRRVQSARDLKGIVEAMADIRSDHRLVAVLFHKVRGTVRAGKNLSYLPPTAQRLLSPNARAASAAPRAVPLATMEVELDGPLGGGMVIALRYDADLKPEGTQE